MIKITSAKRKHLDQIYIVEKQSFNISWSKKILEKDIFENELSIYIVALDFEKVVGYAGMWHIIEEGHINNIAVLKDYRNKGIGNSLILRLTEIAKEKKMVGLTLEVRISNLYAQKLYFKNGYKVEGLRKNYYSDTKEDALIMWKYL